MATRYIRYKPIDESIAATVAKTIVPCIRPLLIGQRVFAGSQHELFHMIDSYFPGLQTNRGRTRILAGAFESGDQNGIWLPKFGKQCGENLGKAITKI